MSDLPETDGYSRLTIAINAVIAVVVTLLLAWWAAGFSVFYEELFRVDPTATGAQAGVGADWVAGNTIPALDFLIAITHAADVILGLFILALVFIHWGAFRRLAARMRQPDGASGSEAATDGGEAADRGGESR